MGDVAGATRARKLDAVGVRVSQSYSRGEAWLLKQILLAVHNPGRMRELAEDPYYPKLLHKAQRLLKSADGCVVHSPLAKSSEKTRREMVADRDEKIREAFVATMDAGEKWVCSAYAAKTGLSVWMVEEATRRLRANLGMVPSRRRKVPRDVAEAIYGAYALLRDSKRWRNALMVDLAMLHRVEPADVRVILQGGWRRYGKGQQVQVDDTKATALLRDLAAARYASHKEAAE